MTAGSFALEHLERQRYLDANGAVPGDCWRTCVAGMVGFARDEVPHFIHEFPGDAAQWWHATVAWIEERFAGMTLACLAPDAFPVYDGEPLFPLVIATGPSPRGDWLHSVLVDWRTGDLVWDPHPTGVGLAGPVVDVAAMASTHAAQDVAP
ncbi:hypothetical protein [Cellulomonas olei]|uniref:hypothetical protein n=1 Tax=Cellulomonas sp. P4 TaxID=3142533 RepID=UPI0031BB66DC